ncbi:MAG: hypothetical protein KJ613_01105 [Nanoarchaeota archaeon]|nr:hypothetical protein [Nanoarchaeota archaeon]MBU1135149.1 hypothetical protein [Nanoarchaeota archaeon]
MSVETVLILVSIIALAFVAVGIYFIETKKKKGKHKPDFYGFFVIGLLWVIISIPCFFLNTIAFGVFFVMGFLFFIIGLANMGKWGSNHLLAKHHKWAWFLIYLTTAAICAIVIATRFFVQI